MLTPDNYAENALKLIQSAKKSVLFQNQYINFRNTDEDFTDLQAADRCAEKSNRQGPRCADHLPRHDEAGECRRAGCAGFSAQCMRFQPACHNKTIIVDGKVVMFGSHNWSNEGVVTNRDASLIFFDDEIATYLTQVYEYDWERLATAKPTPPRVRVARTGEKTPHGFKRVPFSAVFDD